MIKQETGDIDHIVPFSGEKSKVEENSYAIKKEHIETKNVFETFVDPNEILISQTEYKPEEYRIEKELDREKPFLCANTFFVSSTRDGVFNSLNELTIEGKCFLICCLELILKQGEFDTIQWIEENTKFDSYEIFNIIKRWIANPIDKDSSKGKKNHRKNSKIFIKPRKSLDEDFDITDIDKSELTHYPEENQELNNIEFHDWKKSYKTEKKEDWEGIKCDICSKKFRTEDKLKLHICNICDICNKPFAQRKDLRIHKERVHEGKKTCSCNECGAKFFRKHELVRHTKHVHEKEKEKKHNCSLCSSSFLRKIELRKHFSKEHEGIKPNECNICNKSFFEKSKLKNHIEKVHEGKKRCLCPICGSSFFDKHSLAVHIKCVHEKEKLYNELLHCSICNAGFSTKQHLNRHTSAVHEAKKPHLCSLCGVSFAVKERLTRHIAAVHSKETHICTICNVEKPSIDALKSHIKSTHERLPCEQCGKLIGKALMTRHLRDIHSLAKEKKFKCEICGKFASNQKHNLTVHMKIHTGENKKDKSLLFKHSI